MSLLRQSLVTFASRMSITLINIPISMIIARGLGAEGQGIYSAAVTFPNLWTAFGLVGLDAAHLYFLARDRSRFGPIVANSLLIFVGLTALLVPSYILLVEPLVGDRGAAFRPYIVLSSIVVPLLVARHLFLALYLGLGKLEVYNGLMVVSQISLLILVALGVLVAKGGTGLILIVYQVSLVVFLVPSILWLRKKLKTEGSPMRPSRPLFRSGLSYGARGHLATMLNQFSYRFDMILVMRWLGAAPQGYYSISVLMAEKLSHITASVQFVLFPKVSALSREEADRLTPAVSRHTLIWVGIAGLVLYALGRVLIRLFYTDAFLPALSALRALIPGIVALSVGNVLSSYFSGRNRRFLPALAMAAGFLLNIALNFVWIPRFGITGAAWASTLSYSLQSVFMALFFWRVTGISPLKLVVPERGDLELYKGMLAKLASRRRSGGRDKANRR